MMAVPLKITEHRLNAFCHSTTVHREARLIRALATVYPNSIPAKQLMIRAGFRFHAEPIPSFVSLCIHFPKLNQVLSGHGWQAVRTGGTPGDHYSLAPSGTG